MCRWETTTASTCLVSLRGKGTRSTVQVQEGGGQQWIGEDPCTVLDERVA